MKNKLNLSILFLACLAVLSGCEQTKEQLGLTRQAPDEFAVVKRAPLEMPPDFNLRPPSPGAQRPQEAEPELEAQSAVFGDENSAAPYKRSSPDGGESIILQQAGASNAQPGIREFVDKETSELEPTEKPVAERLLGWTMGSDEEAPASVVDAKAEAERIKKNMDDGTPVTQGDTPTIDE